MAYSDKALDTSKIWDPAKDIFLNEEESKIEILAGYPPFHGKNILSEIIFRLNNSWIFSTYEDSNGRSVARPHIFGDSILDSERDELQSNWYPNVDLESLSLRIDKWTPSRWRLKGEQKTDLEKGIKDALKVMLKNDVID